MNSEQRTCQNCKNQFTIEPEDFAFYAGIKVPPPTWCPECRLQRRLVWRNERTLYKRTCDLCKMSVISMYSESAPFPVYCSSCWWSDKWDAREFGMEYDTSRPFFDQFRELMCQVPHEASQHKQSINSEYANYVMSVKNVYLSYLIIESEDVSFSRFLLQCKNCVDCTYATGLENCVNVSRGGFCSDCSDSMIIDHSQNLQFCYDCVSCSECYGYINLRHKKYHIFNEPYTKEEYERKIVGIRGQPLETQRARVNEFFKTQPQRGYIHWNCGKNVSGEELYNCENCKDCYLINYVRDSAYIFNTSSTGLSNELTSNLYDCSLVADMTSSYEMTGGSKSNNCRFGVINDNSFSLEYSLWCYGSNDLFGCIGMRNRKYCILNKEYDKKTFGRVRNEMVNTMESYGEFFPAALSPFAYNETVAQEFFPLSKGEALRLGYRWRDPVVRDYRITRTTERIPDSIEGAIDLILEEVIGCEHKGECNEQCTTAFKIIPQELALYRKLRHPLPRLCPNCRYYQMAKERNPLRLFDARCACGGTASVNNVYQNKVVHSHGRTPCPNEFRTIYGPESGIMAYCKECYESEIV